jgi:hypothetical protein
VEIVELEASFYLVGAILVIFMGWVAYAVTRSPAFAANR